MINHIRKQVKTKNFHVLTAVMATVIVLVIDSYTAIFGGFYYAAYTAAVFGLLFTGLIADADNKSNFANTLDAYEKERSKMLRCIYPVLLGVPLTALLLHFVNADSAWGYPVMGVVTAALIYCVLHSFKLYKLGGVDLPIPFYSPHSGK